MEEIVIEVRAGLVQNVYANRGKIEIKILDWDTDCDETLKANRELEKQIVSMVNVY